MANCIIRIRCGKCKKHWEVYWRDIKDEKSNCCPFCGEEVDRTLWDRDVVHAAASALEANMQLQKEAEGYNKTRFTVNFIQRKDG